MREERGLQRAELGTFRPWGRSPGLVMGVALERALAVESWGRGQPHWGEEESGRACRKSGELFIRTFVVKGSPGAGLQLRRVES